MALFTPETAAEMARRSWEARRQREQIEEQPAPIPQPADDVLDFAKLRLTRVRAQLDRLDALASEETDPKRLKEYADATSRLQEQERQLAGRPLPGTLKPSTKPHKRTEYLPEPTPAVPQPVVGTPGDPNAGKPQTT